MKLDSDDFELFGLPRAYAIDAGVLEARRRDLQAAVHPDRYAGEGAAAQRVAMQWAVRVNEAYARLRDPLRRAACLCELNGVPIGAETNTAMPPAFLAQQMAWREALDDAETAGDVKALEGAVVAHRQAAFARLAHALDVAHDPAAAAAEVRALMFVDRFAADVADRVEALAR